MKLNSKSIFLPVFCVFLYFFSSCSTGIDLSNIDDTSIKLDPSLILPVADANLSVKDILSKIALPGIDMSTNEIYFQWKYNDSLQIDKDVNLVDSIHVFKKEINPLNYVNIMPGVTLTPGNKISFSYRDTLNLEIDNNGQRIDSVNVNSANVVMKFDASKNVKDALLASDFKIEYIFGKDTINDIQGQGMTFPMTPSNFTSPIDSVGFKNPIPTGKFKMYVNGATQLYYTTRITINPSSNFLITKDTRLYLRMKFSDIKLKVAYGRFNITNNIEKHAKIPFKIEDYFPGGLLRFVNPIVNVSAITNVGADINVKLNYMKFYSDTNPTNIAWSWFNNHTTNETTELISGPTIFGQTDTLNLKYDRNNGATDGMFDSKPYPNMANYKFTINSDHTNSREDFVFPENKVKLDLTFKIPLNVKDGSYYPVNDTLKNINIGAILNNVDSAILVLRVNNRIPVKGQLRMTFWKSNLPNDTVPAIGGTITHVTDGLTLGNITSIYDIKSSKVYLGTNTDSLGLAIDSVDINKKVVPQMQTIQIMLNKAQIEQLKQTSSIVLSVFLDTKSMVNGVETATPANITTNSGVDVKIGIYTKINYSTNIGSSH